MSLWDQISKAVFKNAALGSSGSKTSEAVDRNLVRKKQRLMEGFISSPGMLTPRPCTVRDLTAFGGRVDLWDSNIKASLLTSGVVLYLTADRHEVDCNVAWRKDNSLGLRFTSGFHAPTRKYG